MVENKRVAAAISFYKSRRCFRDAVKWELRLIFQPMVESTAASGVLHILGQEVSYNFGHSPLRQRP